VCPPGETKTTGYWPEEGEHRSTATAPHRVVRRQSPVEETLHTWLRERMQELVQWALEAEVREFWGGLGTSAGRRWTPSRGTGTDLRKPRKLTTPLGTVTLRRPRVRGLEERADGRILPLFARRT
jgi:putative transposase